MVRQGVGDGIVAAARFQMTTDNGVAVISTAGEGKRNGFKRYFCAIALMWTMAVVGMFAWAVSHTWSERLEDARLQARTHCDTDIMYRRWNSSHGGVYAPVTEQTRPNDLLDVLERDVITPSGRTLTLLDPAWMTRHVHETARRENDIRGHVTSLKPIRQANRPDVWESEALWAFEAGDDEYSSVESVDGKRYMRLMRPLRTERACLPCHASQGYITGDIRGGVSIAVPMAPHDQAARAHARVLAMGHGLLWLGGSLGIALGAWDIKRRITRHSQIHQALLDAQDDVETRVAQRTTELTTRNEELVRQLAQGDKADADRCEPAETREPVKANS